MADMSAVSAEPQFVSVAEAAARLSCSKRTLYDLIGQGRLPAVRIGSGPRARIRVRLSALDELEETAAGPRRLGGAVDLAAEGERVAPVAARAGAAPHTERGGGAG
jgi:excisionase family DNA binding protein